MVSTQKKRPRPQQTWLPARRGGLCSACLNEPRSYKTGAHVLLPMPLSKPFPVQTFLYYFFEHGQGDKESRSDPYSADSTGVDPPVKRGERDAAARAPAEKAPGAGRSEHGQGSRRLFGILPPEGRTWSSNGVGLHGETIPPTKVHRRQTPLKHEGLPCISLSECTHLIRLLPPT